MHEMFRFYFFILSLAPMRIIGQRYFQIQSNHYKNNQYGKIVKRRKKMFAATQDVALVKYETKNEGVVKKNVEFFSFFKCV